jgi:predicted AAA+ superfamily ATPase
MKRIQEEYIVKDLKKKMVFLTGPRQVGKTFVSKEIMKRYKNPLYLSYDKKSEREIILSENFRDTVDFIVFDEIHKMPQWKNYLKGIYDTKKESLHILVTGSARLDTFVSGGDSLAGRYFLHHLLPFSYKEIQESSKKEKISLDRFLQRGGFPEPFLAEEESDALRWRNQYVQGIIQEDILNFENITSLKAMNILVSLLRERVGSLISYSSLARDLQVAPATVKKYLSILESLFIIFPVFPVTKNIARSLLKEAKYYFYDTGLVKGEEGLIFENFCAVSLLKHALFLRDTQGKDIRLQFIRTKEGKEVDFCITEDSFAKFLYEVKLYEKSLSPHLFYFSQKYKMKGVQIVKEIDTERKISDDLEVLSGETVFSSLSL